MQLRFRAGEIVAQLVAFLAVALTVAALLVILHLMLGRARKPADAVGHQAPAGQALTERVLGFQEQP